MNSLADCPMCEKPTEYYFEDGFDLVPYGDQIVRIEYSTAHCNECGTQVEENINERYPERYAKSSS